LIPEKSEYYNVFWSNYKIKEAIDVNTLNIDLPKI
jgi:hypothetical protein